MRMIKKMALAVSVLALVGCNNTTRKVGNAAELSNNYFLTDKYHLVETISVQDFLDKVNEQTKPTKKEDDKTVDKTELEMKDIFVFNSGTRQSAESDRADILTYLANSIATKELEMTLEKGFKIYRVDMTTEMSAYSSTVGKDKTDANADSNKYIDLLKKFNVDVHAGEIDEDKELKDRFCVGQKYKDLLPTEIADLKPTEGTDGYIVEADKICNGYAAVFNKGKVQPGGYLFNEKMLTDTKGLYHYDRDKQLKTLYTEYDFKGDSYSKEYAEKLKNSAALFVDDLFKPALKTLLEILK